MNGAQFLCRLLEDHGIRRVFGLPGTQNSLLFCELRRSPIEIMVTTHEMSAGFAALGYSATSTVPAVMAIIGGPGFSFAVTPLLEAKLDSIPLLCFVFVRKSHPDKTFHTQQIDYGILAGSVCKEVIEPSSIMEFSSAVAQAMTASVSGEPGPVLVIIDSGLLEVTVGDATKGATPESNSTQDERVVNEVADRIRGAKTLLFCGRGSLDSASEVVMLAERLGAPVLTSTSARGVIPENHPLAIVCDLVPANELNRFIAGFDCVIALGIKFSENSTRGFRLDISPEKLVHIDQASQVLSRNLRSRVHALMKVAPFVQALLDMDLQSRPTGEQELSHWRESFRSLKGGQHEYCFQDLDPPTAACFFERLRAALPDDSILVTDAGRHQMEARKYYTSLAPHGLMVPVGFQSMGFAVSAAMGAKLAQPERTVSVIVGDGGFRISGLELAAAVRAKLGILVIVFNDGYFGHIRRTQLAYDGHECGVSVPAIDMEQFAHSIGAAYAYGPADLESVVGAAGERSVPTILEIRLQDSVGRREKMQFRTKRLVKNALDHLRT